MLKEVNLETLISDIRLLSDQRAGNYITDNEIRNILQSAYDSIFFQINSKNENFFLKEATILPDNEGILTLPDDYYKLKSLRVSFGGDDISYRVLPKTLSEISSWDDYKYNYRSPYGYSGRFYYTHLESTIRVYPKHEVLGKNFTLYYIYSPPQFSDGSTNSALLPEGFKHYLKYYAAAEIGDSESVDTRKLEAKAFEWERKIMTWANDRNKDFPKRVARAVKAKG